MATMLFSAVGTAIGGPIGGSVASLIGGVGLSFAGRLLGRRHQDNSPKITFGQREENIHLTAASEGTPIRKIWGRNRLGGNVVWATYFREWTSTEVSFSPSASSGKGGGGGGTTWTPQYTVVYHYNASFAVAFGEGGPGTSLGRVWADDRELDLSKFNWRFYDGSETQTPDPHIEAKEGVGNVPAYRGICYIVFEDMLLDQFGKHVPTITAEIIRRPIVTDADDISNSLRSVCMIPSTTEFGYGATVIKASLNAGAWKTENANSEDGRTDFLISLDQLCGLNQSAAAVVSGASFGDLVRPLGGSPGGLLGGPTGGNWRSSKGALNACDAVSLVVSWFGTDLRAGNCAIVPKVEVAQKNTTPANWAVAGYSRGYAWFIAIPTFPYIFGPVPYGMPGAFSLPWGTAAPVVSQIDPALLDPSGTGSGAAFGGDPVPAFGGTPSDATVVEAIQEIKRRGLRCVFYPFVMMDVPPGNTLPNPYSDNAAGVGQSVFPWRGRITCSPAPGYAGTVDQTSAAATQINAFFDQYDAMVTHYAGLCVSAGGVDAFIIGSEFVGLTSVRSMPGDGTYPAVTRLRTLAASVRAILGASAKIGYAADWSEYHSHRPNDGTNDVIFNMDPLWSDANIDFIGVDNYLPISDWRDLGSNIDHDPVSGPFSIYDKAYLQSNIEGGEYFDWHYASAADRTSQTRTAIADGAYGKPWVYRNKDIRSWWQNSHKSRPGGVENASATAFAPGSKPVWFTEFGCPAVDKGTNQPNVFVDPKSTESAYPYFSTGARDDAIQRAYLEAMLSYWRDHAPVSGSGVKMVEPRNMFAWAWDARPYPDFPAKGATWRDGANYELGHWLTGRLAEVPLKWIVGELCASVGLTDYDTSGLFGPDSLVIGAVADGVVSPRDVLAQIDDAYQFDAFESGGRLAFAWRGAARTIAISLDELVIESAEDVGYSLTRAQETDLPGAMQLSAINPFNQFAPESVSVSRDTGNSRNVASFQAPTVVEPTYARTMARKLLQQAWAGRDAGTIKLPPSRLAIDPGDCLSFDVGGGAMTMRAERIDVGTFRTLDLVGFDPSLARLGSAPGEGGSGRNQPPAQTHGAPIIEFLDIPLLIGDEPSPWAPRIAAYSSPWVPVAVFQTVGASNTLVATVDAPSAIGELTAPLYSGVRFLWDISNAVYVQFYGDAQLLSKTDAEVFDGANAIAVKNGVAGQWEIIQFAQAELIGPNKYKLSKLLRAQLGTEAGIADPIATGSHVVVLNAATLAIVNMNVGQIGQALTLRAGPANYDPGDSSYFDYPVTPAGVGLRPWSVSHVHGARASGSNDVTFSWARRTRFGGDAWDPPDVPLNEQNESYDLEIMNGADIVRAVLGLAAPSFLYTAAMQTADFGAPQGNYTICVYQNSAQIGRGQVATKTIYL